MPNWCHNRLVVEGDPAEVSRWVEKGASLGGDDPTLDPQPLYLEAFYPTPKNTETEGPFSWHTTHWGTKWDAYFSRPLIGRKNEVGFFLEENRALYRFDTAWSPPLPWLERVARDWPDLTLSLCYGEPGMDFGGEVVLKGDSVQFMRDGDAASFLQKGEMWF